MSNENKSELLKRELKSMKDKQWSPPPYVSSTTNQNNLDNFLNTGDPN